MRILLLLLLVALAAASQISHLPLHKNQRIDKASDPFANATITRTSSKLQIISNSKVVDLMNVPDVFQATDYTCGPASLTAVLNYYHINQRQSDLSKMAKTDPQVGTDPQNLLYTIQQLGYHGQMQQNLIIEQLISTLKAKIPVILLLQAWKDEDDSTPYAVDFDDGHYVVAIGYDQQYIYFEDPWIIGSIAYMSYLELQQRWHGNSAIPQDRRVYGCGIVVQTTSVPTPPVIHMD